MSDLGVESFFEVFFCKVGSLGGCRDYSRLGGELRCGFANVDLAGDHVSEEAGAVLAEELDLAFEAGDGSADRREL
jgi:hypothetical protein